jgi:transcriptional regulator with XRE-family HTH domain
MGLRQIRKQRGFTQTELAKLAGLEQSQISQLERFDDPNPGWFVVRKLARALRARPEQLFSMRSFGGDR